tara:strand:- start:1512 stop:1880 length:369 start_codon:yes stop_codon:yes gene_type:complete
MQNKEQRDLGTNKSEGCLRPNAVQEWIRCQNAIQMKNGELMRLRESRRKLQEHILSNPALLRGVEGRKVRVVEKGRWSPLTYGHLKDCFDECVPDKEAAKQLLEYIKRRRTVKRVQELEMTE